MEKFVQRMVDRKVRRDDGLRSDNELDEKIQGSVGEKSEGNDDVGNSEQ